MASLVEILGLVFGFIWPFWPLVFLRVLADVAGRRSRRGHSASRDMLVIWGFLAICRIAAAIFLPSVRSFLIPEPWNTVLFSYRRGRCADWNQCPGQMEAEDILQGQNHLLRLRPPGTLPR